MANPWGIPEFNKPMGFAQFAGFGQGAPRDFFNEDPMAAWETFMPRGFAPNRQRAYSGMYGDLQSDYQGEMGRRLAAGDAQPYNWTDYLEAMGYGGLNNRLAAMTPREKGMSVGQYAPPVRWRI